MGLTPDSDPSRLAPGPGFIGRAGEIARLMEALRAAAAGSGRVALLAGEAGIGKTRVLREFARHARASGTIVLSGTCYEGDWRGAYAPFAAMLAAHAHATAPDTLRADLGGAAPVLAQLAPELREPLADVEEPPPLDPNGERLRLLQGLAGFAGRLARRAPVALILDDAHWAACETLALLRHLAHGTVAERILLVAAYREQELAERQPLADLMAALARETECERITLGGMAVGEVREVIHLVLAAGHPGERRVVEDARVVQPGASDATAWNTLAERLQAETEGNPLFVRETVLHLLAHLPADAAPRPELLAQALGAGNSSLPAGVRRLLGRRIERLSDAARRLLAAGAACGGPFAIGVAAHAAALDESEALGALDEALAANIVQPRGRRDVYDFTHALIRRAVLESLAPSRQMRLHRAIAESIERLHGDRSLAHAAAIAHHYHCSATLPGATGGVPAALRAAEVSERRGAFEDAANHLRIALDLLPPGDERRPELLGRLGLALAWSMQFDAATPLIEEAADLLVERDSARAADFLADATRVLSAAGRPRLGWRYAERGLRLVGARRDRTWFWLKAHDLTRQRAEAAEDLGVMTERAEFQEVTAVAARLDLTDWERLEVPNIVTPRTRQDVLGQGLRDLWIMPCYDDPSFALRVLRDGVERHERAGRVTTTVLYLAWLARAHMSIGDFRTAREVVARAEAAAVGLPFSIARLNLLNAQSDLAFALDEGVEALLLAAGRPLVVQPEVDSSWAMGPIRAAVARGYAYLGRRDEALALIQTLAPPLALAPGWVTAYLRLVCDTAAALWTLGAVELVETVERSLREKQLPTDLRDYLRDARHALAQVCALQGRHDEAQEWFARARATLERQQARTLRAIVDYDEALMFTRRGAAGDAQRAAELAARATQQFRALGMCGWVRRATGLIEAAPATTPIPPPATVAEAGAEGPLFRHEGQFWRVLYAGREVLLKDAKGVRYLACLLYSPGREVHATDLVRLASDPSGVRGRAGGVAEMSVRADLGDAGPALDARAAAAYRARLEELRAESEAAEGDSDLGRARRLREEMAFLAAEVAAGRERHVASHAQRARIAVTKGLGVALERIRRAHPALGAHLAATVHRGYFCSYVPDPRHPIRWQS